MTETEIIARAQSGDQLAFRQLVETYAPLTERTARVLLANRAQAEDAVQEAWLSAWRGLHTFKPGHPFRPWILAIVANSCRMAARKRAFPSAPLYDTVAGAEDVTLPASIDNVGDEELDRALRELQNEQRQVLALRFYADLQLEEIAELMNVPLGTVKSRQHRALETLRARLRDNNLQRAER